LDNNLLHGDCLTVTGKTIAENLADVKALSDDQDVIRPLNNPYSKEGPLVILTGNLAPSGSVAKMSGVSVKRHVGAARVFNDEESAVDAITHNKVNEGDVVVIRYVGPKGG